MLSGALWSKNESYREVNENNGNIIWALISSGHIVGFHCPSHTLCPCTMELFMMNIDFSLSKAQVSEELATIFHHPPFNTLFGELINFSVHLHRPRPSRNRTGTLTLPDVKIGEHFLNLHSCVRVGSRDIKFCRSQKSPRREVVEKVKALPYINPRIEEQREEREREVDMHNVRMNVLQFGWLCRDYAISVECECLCDGHISFNLERREIRINIYKEDGTYIVVIAPSSINHLSASGTEALVFELDFPPSYEQDQPQGFVVGPLPIPRTKLSYLPIPNHERVAPFTSLIIRVVCASETDLHVFRHLCEVARFYRVEDYEYDIVHRNLFSETAMSAVQRSLEKLDWPVAFQLESLLRGMAIDYVEANQLITVLHETIASKGKTFTANSIRNFRNKVKSHFHHQGEEEASFDIVQLFRQTVTQSNHRDNIVSARPSDGRLYESLHVEVTPTTMFLSGPFPERSNRVIRAYGTDNHQNFLRVSFVDEGGLHIRFDQEIDGRKFIQSRVGLLLFDGLQVAGRKFDFLAYSQSALKEHSVWFVKPFQDWKHGIHEINAAEIIRGLGMFDGLDFDPNLDRCPARWAARIAQTLTSTEAVKVEVESVMEIEDITTTNGEYKFTDGVGTISNDLRHRIWAQLRKGKRKQLCDDPPSAFQIRFMGSKGMVAVDHKLTGSVICLRPSMIKFRVPTGKQHDIEIARTFDRPGPYFLNRPLIMLLDGLGVPFCVFKKYQDDAVNATERAAKSLKDAATLLDEHGLGASYRISSILLNLDKLGITNLDEFYRGMIGYAINHVLRDLKNHARIPVPGAWTLVGVADTHRHLPPNTIFACVKPINGERKYLKGPVLISRSPCIHPGDVTVVEAIGAPPPGSCFAEEALPNTVVFSVQGTRPIPSCLGGGDLDGDLYNLIPLSDPDYKDLQSFRPANLFPPASYEAAKRQTLDRPSTMRDVAEFFMEYISSDVVGIVAINWLIIADQSGDGIFDPDCIKLADLHSNAVDYPKSGRPVRLHEIPMLKHKVKPDWNAPETVQVDYESGTYYKSKTAIGQLFRSIDLPIEQQSELQRKGRGYIRMKDLGELEAAFDTFNLTHVRGSVFSALEKRVEEFTSATPEVHSEQLAFIARLYQFYAAELRALCVSHMITRTSRLSEAEAIIGTIAQKTSQSRRRKEAISKIREDTDLLVRGIREDLAGDDSISAERGLQRAWMAWKFAMSQGKTFGAKSFMWIAFGAIFSAIEEIATRKDSKF